MKTYFKLSSVRIAIKSFEKIIEQKKKEIIDSYEMLL